ncbi:hypothetical protein BZA70DRAFT_283935 [Myxozyma melibiosi]|uniref:BHLH domain-containing protein n=1 Tax=Myxozyma melibiosi TaxID=54550 RepID=A0ABR1EZW9_9ASCO
MSDHSQQQQHDMNSYIDFNGIQLDLSAFDMDTSGALLDFDHQNSDGLLDQSGRFHDQGQGQSQSQQQHQQLDQQLHQQQRQLQQLQMQKQLQQQFQSPMHMQMSQDYQQPQQMDQHAGSQGSSIIPPTPSSIDFKSGVFNSPSGTIDAYSMRDENIFTPLLSPAVTPLEHPISIQKELGYSSNYFSPLTSPALEAQIYPYSSASPGDSSLSGSLSKHRLRTASYSGSSSSPAQKPVTIRQKSSETNLQRSSKRRATAAFAAAASANGANPGDASSSESISPEPLLALPESSMAPPPVPVSKSGTSAALRVDVGATTQQQQQQHRLAPVTPASLMNLSKDRVGSITETAPGRDAADAIIDGVARRRSSVIATSPRSASIERSPSLSASAHSSPAIRPQSRSSARAGSVSSSPVILPKSSGSATMRPIKPARSRSGSVSASPNLQVRISPNLKPLLPEGADDMAMLLASKSNYQNIVEGKHSQLGLSYPEQLSINLTSKRTSHKIAEQGRRNRINNALSELNLLLIDNINLPVSDDDDEESKNQVPQQCSKANTVELAIDYIKKLHTRIDKLKVKLKESNRELEAEREKYSSVASVSSNADVSPVAQISDCAMEGGIDDAAKRQVPALIEKSAVIASSPAENIEDVEMGQESKAEIPRN